MGGNLTAEACSVLRISTALCCAFFSDTVCCDHGASKGGGKKPKNASIALKWKLAALPEPASSSFELQSWDLLWFVPFLFAGS